MEYRLEIFTDDPIREDFCYPNGPPWAGTPMCEPITIKSNLIRNIKRQAETQILKVLAYQYDHSPHHITHELDMDAVWKYVNATRAALAKKVYAAYKHDFEGYIRYKAVLTPIEKESS